MLDDNFASCHLRDMKTNRRKFRKTHTAVRVAGKTCGMILKGLAVYDGKGFLTEEGAVALEESKRKPVVAK
jgi:hypothetical protein